MDEKQLEMYNALKDLGSEEMLNIILNYHGTQLLSNDFYDELVDQGIIEGSSDDEDEDDEDESEDEDDDY